MSEAPSPTDVESRRVREVREHFKPLGVRVAHVTASMAILRAEKYCALAQEAALAPLELSLPRYEVLTLLYFAEGGTMTMRALSEATLLIPATVTYTADALQNRGLILRIPDPQDRRGVMAQITKAGRRLVENAFWLLDEIDWGVSQYSEDEAEHITALLSRMPRPVPPVEGRGGRRAGGAANRGNGS